MGGHSDLVEFFIEKNCNTFQINCECASLSLLACQSGELALVHKLESLNLFLPDSSDLSGSGILHYSSMSNNVDLLKYLLNQYQLSIDVKDHQNRTPLHIASWYASSSVVEYIVSIQGNEAILVNDNNGKSCLHYATDTATHIPAGIVYSKFIAQSDASVIDIINRTRIKKNIDFIKRNERVKIFSSLLKKASLCPNFDINATTNDGQSLLHLASVSGSTLLVKALKKYNINCTLDNDGTSLVYYAALSGSTSVLSYIISQYNLNANDTDTYGHTPLVYSCWSGSINSVKYLIDNHNSDPYITNNDGMTCLHYSCRHGHIDITQYFIEVQHCDINRTDNEGHTLVHHAAWSGSFDLVQYLITEQGLSPTAVDKNGLTALHYASVSLNLSLVKELITTYQLDPHQADSNGMLPIHYAAQSGDILLLELYIKDYKCSLSLTDNKGWNVNHYSSLKGHTHFIKHITSQYPQYISLLHSTDNEGRIPLHLACGSGSIQLVTFLINDMKCDVNAKDTSNSSCVTFACSSGNLDLVRLLIQQYKLEPININNTGFSVLHAAAQTDHTHILEWYSQEYSVDITNYTSNNKYTLAHSAAYKGKLHCLQELINKYQCDVNATTTNTGSTVLHKACEGGHVPVVLYLTSLPQCNVAAKTSNESTVLHITCEYSDSLPILKHLVENHQLDLCAMDDNELAPIHLACIEGRLNLVEYIIEQIPSSLELLCRPRHDHTPFLTAVYFNQLEVIKYLISKKCNLSATDDEGFGAVHISVERGHLNILKYLIDNNYCNPNATDHQEHTPLHIAVLADKLEIIEYLLMTTIPSVSVAWICKTKHLLDSPQGLHYDNVHVNAQNIEGNSPLHLACRMRQQHMVKILSRASFSASCLLLANKEGQTPLHLAVASGHKDTAEALLESVIGSSTHHDLLTATDNEESTVFHTACSIGHIDVFRYLASIYPQGVNVMDNRGRSLLYTACEGWDIEIVKELVEGYRLNPKLQDKDGITCLHLLAERKGVGILQFGMDMRNIEMYQYLKHHVTNPIPKDKPGRSPLHYACRANNIPIVRFLVDTIPSCSPDDPDNNGYTSVHAACEAGSMELVYYFLDILKCNAHAETNDFKTLLYFASKSSNLELVRFLVERHNLKPRPHDIKVAQAVKPDSSMVRYLQKVHSDIIIDIVMEARKSSGGFKQTKEE
ncbi:PREDICTED: serine/threonine-protein phosphatase 6 regulatory ankyrin repeat subunit B-like [Amphimedon queenslandica]|nr:PREDICTED: serine/threonine-protein phosphatase 6 regulatory ankyrin repeat subunit B-like [Amphimedon queenslandica]|eukprot:XP_019850283.1 PREDICTED: serine/threonine-protein phosphatase 6 regulatory ankyrin repeat subunit B-like [Amphimedon queenslandica]